jgi:TPR repeat protein
LAASLFKKASKSRFPESFARVAFLHRHGIGLARHSALSALFLDLAQRQSSIYGCLSSALDSASLGWLDPSLAVLLPLR